MRPELVILDDFTALNTIEQAKIQANCNLLVSCKARFLWSLESLKSGVTSKQAKSLNSLYRKILFARNFFERSNLLFLLVCLYLVDKRSSKPP